MADPTGGRPDLYDYDAASALTFYAPETIRRMTGDGTLERGRHFIVARWYRGSFLRRCCLITAAGAAWLLDRRANGRGSPHARTSPRESLTPTNRTPRPI